MLCLNVYYLTAVSPILGSHEAELRAKLLKNYDKFALPNVFTRLSLGFTILGLDMDEENEIVYMDTWVKMSWNDPRMKWESSDYPDVTYLAVPTSQVWLPDLTLYNNAHQNVWNPITKTLVLAYSSGKMLTVPTAKIPAICIYDMTYWPHDIQNCSAKFGSWVHSGHAINLTRFDDKDPLSVSYAIGVDRRIYK